MTAGSRRLRRWAAALLVPAAALAWLGTTGAGHQVAATAPAMTGQALEGRLGEAALRRTLAELDARLERLPGDPEARLLRAMVLFKLGRLPEARAELDELVAAAPGFGLAHVVRGDLLLAGVEAVSDVGAGIRVLGLGDPGDAERRLEALRAEARARLQAYLARNATERVPLQLLQLDPATGPALLVDKLHNRLYVFESTGPDAPPRLVRDVYVSIGKLIGDKQKRGDLRTPEGVYRVTTWIPDEKLPDRYGLGAFPVNYPNLLDRRRGKTGYGIWLHGTEKRYYSRPPRDSEGCVVLANSDLAALRRWVTPGRTPVIIASSLDWVPVEQWRAARAEVLAALEAWRRDWESLDVERYLSHYDADFWSGTGDLAAWAARKRRIARQKTFQKVALSELSLFAYPRPVDGRRVVVAWFRQDYTSNNYRSRTRKRLYLARGGDGPWRILYEGR